ncbi:TAF5-like RNA polymerase II p300/CBP-associated factor-associated factor 65 kDa subunit 5L isoform X1 [Ceratitis capitata]|uniref:TAF5-like RNA polymerase II p300/CBP-associated factor-associated factor 65 kDa subunit 5L isoform X1 n=2 Tax=Ceratitis capitata TaxID=7213 RepID=UPI0006188F11|nr:TAF5-like RNA polymerase II p300/CBP-associated factor-associated factor 65 kDa subunit 5L isoform X1 [Ceratitis capitata]
MPEMGEKSSGNKVKKSKNDLFRSSLGYYLKKKSFVGNEKFRKSDFLLLQNKRQFMVQKMLDLDLQSGNSFGFSNVLCITNNHHIVDQQFGRFSQFVESQSDFIRLELRRLYAPMLCHLYVELMKAREQKAALELLKKYSQLVSPVETYEAPLPTKINGCSVANDTHADQPHATTPHTSIRFATLTNDTSADPELLYFTKLIQTLSACTKLETAESDPDIVQFRSSKYEIHTTEAVVEKLRTYLEKRGHVLILNLLYSWIHLHVVDNEVQKWSEEDILLGFESPEDDEENKDEFTELKPKVSVQPDRSSTKRAAKEPPEELMIKSEKSEDNLDEIRNLRIQQVADSLQNLRTCREQILKSHTQHPYIIKLTDRSRGLSCADVDSDECHLVAGFNNSIVQLWQLNQQTFRGKNLYARCADTICRWEINNYGAMENETEDQIEFDVREHEKNCNGNNRRKKKFEAGKYGSNSFNEYGGIELRGHGAGVTDVRFSKHYPLVYSTSKDSTIRSWRAESYSCAYIYRGHRYPVWCLDESPVGMYIATGSKDLTARLWSLERDFPLITFAGHTQDVECIAFHPNGNYMATGSADLSVRLWCVTSGKLMRVFSECKQPVTNIAFSPDGKMLAAGGEESKIRIFDLAAGAQMNELKDHTAAVSNLAWSKGGRHLASACRDGSLRVWDVKKLSPINDTSGNSSMGNSSSSSSSSSTTLNKVMALSSNCQRLVKVAFSRQDEVVCAIGC